MQNKAPKILLLLLLFERTKRRIAGRGGGEKRSYFLKSRENVYKMHKGYSTLVDLELLLFKLEKLGPSEVLLHFRCLGVSQEKRAGQGKCCFQMQLFRQLAGCITVTATQGCLPTWTKLPVLSQLLPLRLELS